MGTNRVTNVMMHVLAALLLVMPMTLVHAGEEEGQYGYGYGMGYGMGPGMMMGPGMGYGMGPGMMMGPGMGHGMGPGMMGPGMGYGMGPGMMGHMMGMMHGYGGGPGMMGGYGYGMGLDLTEEQREKMQGIQEGLRKQHWEVMGKMMDKYDDLRDLYGEEQPDPDAVGRIYSEIADLRRQMVESHVEAHNRMHEVLTDEQREQLRQWQRRGWGPQQRQMPQGGMGPGGHMMNR